MQNLCGIKRSRIFSRASLIYPSLNLIGTNPNWVRRTCLLTTRTHSQNLPGGPWIQREQPCVHSTPSLHSHTDLEVRRNLCSLYTSTIWSLGRHHLCCLQSEVRSTYSTTIWCLGRHLETTSCSSTIWGPCYWSYYYLGPSPLQSGPSLHYSRADKSKSKTVTSYLWWSVNYLKLSEVPNTV